MSALAVGNGTPSNCASVGANPCPPWVHGIDLAVRIGHLADSSLIARPGRHDPYRGIA